MPQSTKQSAAHPAVVATHRGPDVDAVAAAWLAERYLFPGRPVQVVFVARNFKPSDGDQFDAVVDVGNVFDASRLLFDHKPPGLPDRHQSCAARLVWEHLTARGVPLEHLEPLIELVHDGDSVRRRGSSAAYQESRRSGLHAAHHAAVAAWGDDLAVYRAVTAWLDAEEERLRACCQPHEQGAHERAGTDAIPLHLDYQRGRRYREELGAKSAFRCDRCRSVLRSVTRPVAPSKADPNRRVADALAAEYRITRKELFDAYRLAWAVDIVAANCGAAARQAILAGHPRLPAAEVLRISRTSPERQRHALGRALERLAPLDTEGKGCPVFDTVDYGEVKSRLRRAQGVLRVCLLAGERLACQRPTPEEAVRLRERLDDILRDTQRLAETVAAAADGEPCPCDLAKRASKPTQAAEPRDVPDRYRGVIGLLSQARSWLTKCVKDVPHLVRRGILPLPAEKEEVRARAEAIIGHAEGLLALATSEVNGSRGRRGVSGRVVMRPTGR